MTRTRKVHLNPFLAVAGLRVSTNRDKQELGEQAQRTAIQAWAKKHDITIVAWYLDEMSGAAPIEQRKGLLDAIRDLANHRARTLVFARVDRLSRDAATAALVDGELRRMGAQLQFADGNGGGDGPTAQLIRGILTHVGAFERSLIKGRVQAAVDEKRKRGERLGLHAPFGFRIGSDGKHLEPDEKEQATIKAAFELRDAGVSYPKTIVELTKRGHLSRAGTPLSLPTLWKVMKREQATHEAEGKTETEPKTDTTEEAKKR